VGIDRRPAPRMRRIAATALCALAIGACPAPSGPARRPVESRDGMVATSSPDATRVGVEVLRRGGNAVDAAVAVAFALGVAEPWNSGVGGGSLILVCMRDGRTAAIDGRETAPAAARRDMYLDGAGRPTEESRTGPRAIAVPGTVAALALAREKFGSRPWKDLIAPSIALAREGIAASRRMAEVTAFSAVRLRKSTAWSSIFLPRGIPPLPGQRVRQPALAASYRAMAEEGPAALYGGPLGRAIAGEVKARGGILTLSDLRDYRPVLREPLRGTYRGYEVLAFPPPGGGVVVMETLNLLERFRLREEDPGSAGAIHVTAEALKLAFADRAVYLGDPGFVKVPTRALIAKSYAARRGARIRGDRTVPVEGGGDVERVADEPGGGAPGAGEGGHTTHFSIVDREGNAVAVTQTINLPYGSGVVAPGTGIVLNDEMDDFSAKPGAPNAFGLVGTEANAIAPGKRPLSSQSPTILLRGGHPVLVLGSPGGPRIVSAVVETILNVVDFGMNVQEAVDARRFHHQWKPDVLLVEKGTPPEVIAELGKRGHAVREMDPWGSVQAVAVDPAGGRERGGSDSRSPGFAAGP